MPLTNGQKVSGSSDGHQFTGYIRELNGISTIQLDRPMTIGHSYHHDRLYMDIDHETGKTRSTDHYHDPHDHVKPIPDVPGSEYELIPLDCERLQDIAKAFKIQSFPDYTAQIIARRTTYKTVKRTVTCEYGHKHIVNEREPIPGKVDRIQAGIAYFFHALARYVEMQQEIEYQTRSVCWHMLASKLAGCGWGQAIHDADYTGLDPASVKAYKQATRQIYIDTCDKALIAIFGTSGPYLNRYLGYESRVSSQSSRANIERMLGGKITPEGLVK